ncbi:hypothetical protein NDN08_001227 [Rhodosorus marinus]|uniref:FACT complex subunit n=1 Tax=Rhodosorus marinus TaxID=101924 RepID=A0AAV8UQE9_9RHOD|nr:hypothetical protein NDN08_001227 [Rhodosorus marinus]
MAHQVPSETTMEAVEQARITVDDVMKRLSAMDKSDPAARGYEKIMKKADDDLKKAELMVKEMKEKVNETGKAPARAKESINPSSGIKRALMAIQNAPKTPRTLREGKDEKVLMKAGLPKFTTTNTGLAISVTPDEVGLRIECKNVFIAGLWFVPVSQGNLVPECAMVFGVDEKFSRWRTSKYRVFGILSERATAAIQYFWSMESQAQQAVEQFLEWLALHKTVLSDVSAEDNRRLAFDASRAIFLPPCVRAFDGDKRPRHPRACVPERQERSERLQQAPQAGQPLPAQPSAAPH